MTSSQEILLEEEPLEFFLTCYYCGKTIKSKKKVSNNLPLILRDREDSLWRRNRIIILDFEQIIQKNYQIVQFVNVQLK